jgi:hypothetical protein
MIPVSASEGTIAPPFDLPLVATSDIGRIEFLTDGDRCLAAHKPGKSLHAGCNDNRAIVVAVCEHPGEINRRNLRSAGLPCHYFRNVLCWV